VLPVAHDIAARHSARRQLRSVSPVTGVLPVAHDTTARHSARRRASSPLLSNPRRSSGIRDALTFAEPAARPSPQRAARPPMSAAPGGQLEQRVRPWVTPAAAQWW
jgi:hypothetical protein